MRAGLLVGIVFSTLLSPVSVHAQATSLPVITSPSGGQILKGQVSISGTSDIPNFASAVIAFSYSDDSTDTWFVIQSSSQPISNGNLGIWDTTMISDGLYALRLRVTLQDGSYQDALVTQLHVMNYTPQLTPTSAPTASPTAALPIPTPIVLMPSPSPTAVTPTPVPLPTPTFLPGNPAELTPSEIYGNLKLGALVFAGIFVLIGILIRLRRS